MVEEIILEKKNFMHSTQICRNIKSIKFADITCL